MSKRVACYVRVSTQEQANEGYSVAEQTERLELYCKAHGWKISEVYTDPGFSGANIDRPALQRMMKDASAGRFSLVLVYKLDRLSRSQKDTMYLIEDVFLKNGVDFISMSENFDTSSPFGRAMIGILSVFAQLERDQIKERMGMGRAGRAKLGKWHGGGNVPIGYDFRDGRLVLNEYEAMQVRRAFSLLLEGHTISDVSRGLSGYVSKYGPYKPENNTVALMLRNPIYIGMIKTPEGYIRGEHEAIIDQDTFDHAQVIMRRISARYEKRPQPAGRLLLSGLCRCRRCGAYYSVTTQGDGKGHTYKYYSCTNRIRAWKHPETACRPSPRFRKDDLDKMVLDEVRKLQEAPEAITGSTGDDDTVSVITARLQEIEKQVQRMIRLYSLGAVNDSDIEKQLQLLYAERDKLTRDKETAAASKISVDHARRILGGSVIDDMEEGARHDLLVLLIDHIDINDDGIMIHWNF